MSYRQFAKMILTNRIEGGTILEQITNSNAKASKVESNETPNSASKEAPQDISTEVNLSTYFPDTEKYTGQQLSNISLYSMSKPKEAAEILQQILIAINIEGLGNPAELTITDGTAHVGGNVISFAKVFKQVNAIELDKVHFDMLEHNIKDVYKLGNVELFNDDYNIVSKEITQDIVFLDPPFGGPNYFRNNRNADYYLGKKEISEIVKELASTKIVCLKVGINFSYNNFFNRKYIKNVYYHKSQGFNILCVIMQQPDIIDSITNNINNLHL